MRTHCRWGRKSTLLMLTDKDPHLLCQALTRSNIQMGSSYDNLASQQIMCTGLERRESNWEITRSVCDRQRENNTAINYVIQKETKRMSFRLWKVDICWIPLCSGCGSMDCDVEDRVSLIEVKICEVTSIYSPFSSLSWITVILLNKTASRVKYLIWKF